MIFSEALQSKAFSGHQTANSAAALNDPLGAGGIQRMGKGFSNPPPFGVATGITELDGISGSRFLIALLGGLFYEKHTGHLGTAVGHPCLSIVRGQAACILSQLGLSSAEVYKHGILGLISVQSFEITGVQCQGGIPDTHNSILAVEAHQIQPGFTALAASAGGQSAGDSICVVDSGALGSAEDLNKSFSICAWDR